jgi:hypothetical protein
MNPRLFLDVDPAALRLPTSRRFGADPFRLHQQTAKFGAKVHGMPTIEVSRGTDGELVINNGVSGRHALPNCLRERWCGSR